MSARFRVPIACLEQPISAWIESVIGLIVQSNDCFADKAGCVFVAWERNRGSADLQKCSVGTFSCAPR